MKFIVEIWIDDEEDSTEYLCADFPSIGSEFVTLYLEDFERILIPTKTIKKIRQYFTLFYKKAK